MKVVVFTCEPMYFCVPVFAYLFNTFWSSDQSVIIVGYEEFPYVLPSNFSFHSIAPITYRADEWSTGIIEFLERFEDDYFVWSLEDYWLSRTVDRAAVAALKTYLECHSDVWRVDLTGDRLYSNRAVDRGAWHHLDMIETTPDVPYCLSTQMSVMNRRHMLSIMKPHLSPWQFELQDQVSALGALRVLGTRQMPVRYTIGWGTNSVDEHGNPVANFANIPKPQFDFIAEHYKHLFA